MALGEQVVVSAVPVSTVVQSRFIDALEQLIASTSTDAPEAMVCFTLHGTRAPLDSIFEKGLLIPGKGNSLKVINGSVHGLGIYTANLDAAWLSWGFCDCDHPQMLICAVLQSSAVTHPLDAQVIFNEAHVVPLFQAKRVQPVKRGNMARPQPLRGRMCLQACSARSLPLGFGTTKAEYTITEDVAGCLKVVGFDLKDLLTASFNLRILRAAGFTATDLAAEGFKVEALKAAGFTAVSLRGAGFDLDELITASFTARDLKVAGFDLKALLAVSFSLEALKTAGFTATDLRVEGFSLEAMKVVSFTATNLREAGFDLYALTHVGFTAKDLKAAGFDLKALLTASFDLKALKAAGFTGANLRAEGFNFEALKAAGFTARNLHEAGFDWALVIASFNFSALRRQGFTAQQLRTGFGVCPMRKGAGFQIKLLRNAGFKANELSDAGFDVQQLLSAGFNPRQLQKLKR